jgi:hypothetical protein
MCGHIKPDFLTMTFLLGLKQPTCYQKKDDMVSQLNIDALVDQTPYSTVDFSGLNFDPDFENQCSLRLSIPCELAQDVWKAARAITRAFILSNDGAKK